MYGRNLTALLQHLAKDGRLALDPADEIAGPMLVVHAWTVGADDAYITLHVEVDEGIRPDPVIEAVRAQLVDRNGFHHVTVQVEHACCDAQSHEAPVHESPAHRH
jgi:hypothetical protein